MAENLKADLARICDLQARYSPHNTPEMKERGQLLRGPVKAAVQAMRPVLAPPLGEFGDDFHVDASDGIGRKTELPWVRFCSKEMSPRPTQGFYCVIHFSTDSSAIHVTLGCGSSRFFNGYTVVLPDEEIDSQTEWARAVIEQKLGSLAPFTDPPQFGASRPLPKSFERATAISKKVPVDLINAIDLELLLREAASRLRIIYQAQATGRDLTPADQEEIEIAALISPGPVVGRRQGFGLPVAAKKVVEARAMALAEAWLSGQGYGVKDCSASKPYDLEATKGGVAWKVEVRGTTSDRADAILMTRNEVRLHQTERGSTALIVVSKILLQLAQGTYIADGGVIEGLIGWDIGDWVLEPTAFRLTRR